MPLTLNLYILQFLDYCQYQKRYSKHTTIAYKTDLTSFATFLFLEFNEINIELAKTTYIRSWLAGLKEAGVTSKSILRKLSCIRSFYNFLLKKEVIKINPAIIITAPKIPKRLPVFLEKNATDALFADTVFTEGLVGLTEKLLLLLLYSTGIRRGEIINIKEHSIDFAIGTLKVLGKGNKERILPLSQSLIDQIKFYIAEKRKAGFSNIDNFLFVNLKGKALDPKQVYNIAKKYLSKVTTAVKNSPHVLRHSFATQLMNNGADLNAVKELLGHSSLAATQIYTHNNIEKLKNAHKIAHPKA